MDPGALFSKVDQLELIRVEPGFGRQALKEGLVRSMAARAHDEAAHTGSGRSLPQALPSFRQARERKDLTRRHSGEAPRVPGDRSQVHDAVDLAGAAAQGHGDTLAVTGERCLRRRSGDERLTA